MYTRFVIFAMLISQLGIMPTFQTAQLPILQVWSEVTSVSESELLQQTARIPLAWSVENRPDGTNLVFEQMLLDDYVNVELPRENPWVASSGEGIVAPVFPTDPTTVQLRVRLIRLADNTTLVTAELALTMIRDGQWQTADPNICYQPPIPPFAVLNAECMPW